jgi:pseudaminic acid synthase
MKNLKIQNFSIGPQFDSYIIAEMSANHRQSFEAALELPRAAKQAGADAIKLQTYTPETITIASRRPEFLIGKGAL